MSEPVLGQGFGNVQSLAATRPGTAPRHIFTVMGHVRNQRAFELATASPSLVQVVETFAQGLTETASNNVRIVRNGRVINTFYRTDSSERLMPGDLVVVDGKSAHGTIFRGGRANSVSADGLLRIGLIGIRPYPVILQLEQAQPVTSGWVARQLGQSDQAAVRARPIVPRRFTQTDSTTPLSDCSVVVFDPATIDASRLPPNLPTPLRPGQSAPPATRQDAMAAPRSQPGSIDMPRPLAQIPVARGLTSPGVAAVPQTPPGSSAAGLQPPRVLPTPNPSGAARSEQPLQRDAEERVRDLLTAPSSVPVESSGAPSATDRKEPGRVSSGDQSATAGRSPVASEIVSRGSSRRAESQPVATKPFQSYADQPASSGTAQSSDAPVELPLTPAEPSDNSDVNSISKKPVSAGETAASAVDAAMPFPTPVASSSTAMAAADETPENAAAVSTNATLQRAQSGAIDAARKGTVAPKPVLPTNWPLVSAAAIGGLAAVSIMLMMIVVARQKMPQPTPVVPGERYWLDRIIQNDLPIDDEPVTLPNGEQLFGKATPIRRLDAAHQSVPKPHFLAAGGESGVQRSGTPSPAEPESGESDSPTATTDPKPATQTPQRDRRPDRSQPAVPLRPAAEHRSVATAVNASRASAPTAARQPVAAGGSGGISLDITRLPSSGDHGKRAASVEIPAAKTTDPGKSARRTIRVDNDHQSVPRKRVAAETAQQLQVRRSATQVQAAQQDAVVPESVAVDMPVEPDPVPKSAVPRPRHLQRRRVVAADSQPAMTSQQVDQAAGSPVSVSSAEISVKPARSIAETADLLDRVLSSVQREKRGDR